MVEAPGARRILISKRYTYQILLLIVFFIFFRMALSSTIVITPYFRNHRDTNSKI